MSTEEFVLSKCLLYLGTVVSSRHWILSRDPCEEGEEKESLIPNQLKTHADMQTQPEMGDNRKFGFMSQIHKCQVMNTHTAMESSL